MCDMRNGCESSIRHRALPGHEPPRAEIRVVDYVPFAEIMPYLDVFITNGGYGGVQMALANGVPIVVAGATEDKPEAGARVAWVARAGTVGSPASCRCGR